MTQEGLGEPSLRTPEQADASGPHGASSLPPLPDLDPDIQLLDARDVEQKWELPMFSDQHGPVSIPDSDSEATPTSESSTGTTYRCPCCGASVPPPP
jgi:hypothetical protein